jgi:hypothetical protein
VFADCVRPSDACADELADALFVFGDDNTMEEEADVEVDMVAVELGVVGTGTVLSVGSEPVRSMTAAEGEEGVLLFATMAVAVAGCAL